MKLITNMKKQKLKPRIEFQTLKSAIQKNQIQKKNFKYGICLEDKIFFFLFRKVIIGPSGNMENTHTLPQKEGSQEHQ